MGTVYRAVHTRLKKPFAIKVLHIDRTADPHAVARFQRELEAIGRLDHDNIGRATDAGEVGGLHFLVMELVDGIDLSRLIRHRGPLPIADACELARQAALGLQCAHERGLVHRDVKPSNLLLSAQGELKVLDLGLALLSHGRRASGELTATGQVMGTADYMAPEQWEASHSVDIRAEVYSLGCTLHTLLTGRPPFGGAEYDSVMKKMAAHAQDNSTPDRGKPLRRAARARGGFGQDARQGPGGAISGARRGRPGPGAVLCRGGPRGAGAPRPLAPGAAGGPPDGGLAPQPNPLSPRGEPAGT
jgi:serine/threonine protein kinase